MKRQDDYRDFSFPDELGFDLFDDLAGNSDKQLVASGLKPFAGYLTANWFGPFLLAPPRRWEKGHC